MFAKKYFSALIILLTLLGFYKEQTPTPNQEIELQFANNASLTQQTEELIHAIKQQLEALGVENIQVRQQAEGTLKIAYYSDENVAAIKDLLQAEGLTSKSESGEYPVDRKTSTLEEYATIDGCKIDVYELQTTSSLYAGLQGKFILALQKEYDKSPSPNSFATTNSFISGEFKTTIEFAYTESTYTAIPKENTSYEIPDVRAGPFTGMHS